MNELPLVSIVTPAYNQARYLKETIESVLAQDYPNIEYIVIDDGSSDSTPEILIQYDKRVRAVRQENMGQAKTLNKGWAMSNGSIIGYLSSDDILYPGAIRKLVERLLADESIVCVFPDANLIDDQSIVVKKNVCRPFDLAETLIRQECYIGPGAIFRKNAFDIAGGWRSDLRLAPDREFWIRLAANGRFEMCTEILAGYRLHSSSISYSEVSEEAGREYLRVLDSYFGGDFIPEEIKGRQLEAYGYAYLLIARNCFRAGHWRRGWALYKEACQLHPRLGGLLIKIRLLRNIVSKPVRNIVSTFRSLIRV